MSLPRGGFAVASKAFVRKCNINSLIPQVGMQHRRTVSPSVASRTLPGRWNTSTIELRRARGARMRNVVRGVQASSSVPAGSSPGKVGSPNRGPSAFVALLALVCTLAAITMLVTLATGTSVATLKAGFISAFSIIFISELGDKTFFIAALLAMRRGRTLVFTGATAALALMTIVSVAVGTIFQQVPTALTDTQLPIGQWAGALMLVYFGIRNIKDALDATPAEVSEGKEATGELADAEAMYSKAQVDVTEKSTWGILAESFTLIFMAEWGDRSMLATIALGVAQNPVAVATGAVAGHALATLIAVLGGSFLSKYISERFVGLLGGGLFLVFAVLTVLVGFEERALHEAPSYDTPPYDTSKIHAAV
eukprot:CAMPEP_0198211950 /NCGR_PEP_ID=MMETSP1445-20131203/25435_1 /TAXON_ID=36898 /ORGANISM="Pyramimonas sp., Strain CCMP2087" /LENGTH=365 /DNA_ID=CAMNT_0043886311 /DNA_START=167 /DNA_END=1265 /DNA_ORIENTATION=+